LIELGFTSNEDDEKRMNSAKFQAKTQQGIVDGIIEYFNYLNQFHNHTFQVLSLLLLNPNRHLYTLSSVWIPYFLNTKYVPGA